MNAYLSEVQPQIMDGGIDGGIDGGRAFLKNICWKAVPFLK